MVDFYRLPELLRIFISLYGTMVVAVHTVALIYGILCHMSDREERGKSIFEVLLLCYLVVLAMIPSTLNFVLRDGMCPDTIFVLARYLIFVVLLFFSFSYVVKEGKFLSFGSIVVAALTLPLFEVLPSFAYCSLYFMAMTFFTVRGLWAIKTESSALKNGITATSIKEAIGSLNSGVLFCEKRGGIILQNKRMVRLMVELVGNPQGDGLQFYKLLEASPLRESIENNLVFRLGDGTVWRFAKAKIKVRKTDYFQITATDVTLRWQLIDELEEQNRLSEKRSSELRYLLDNLFQIRYRQERLHLRTTLHDILGQQITLFQRKLQGDELPTSKDIEELIACLDIKQYDDEGKNTKNPIDEVISAFSTIGVEVRVAGVRIEDDIAEKVFAHALRESASNAVRHGFATKIEGKFEESRDMYILSVSNNGMPPPENIVYGTGLAGMEYRLNELGGRLDLELSPHYKVIASIPKKEQGL